MALNYPYFIYPGYPMCGYMDVCNYNKNIIEVLKLLKLINASATPKTLFHMTLGACMEEYFSLCDEPEKRKLSFQWEQLFPYHLRQYGKNGGKVINIIISPTRSFADDTWIEPSFIRNTQEFVWDTSDHNCIKSTVYDVTIYVFYTMMPSLDPNYDLKYNSIVSRHKMQKMNEYVSLITRNEHDVEFIRIFYSELKKLKHNITTIGGAFTCFSFVVFETSTKKSIYNNFSMIREIKSLFVDGAENALLAEWMFTLGSYTLTEFRHCHNHRDDLLITYTSSNHSNIAKLNINYTTNVLIIEREFKVERELEVSSLSDRSTDSNDENTNDSSSLFVSTV